MIYDKEVKSQILDLYYLVFIKKTTQKKKILKSL